MKRPRIAESDQGIDIRSFKFLDRKIRERLEKFRYLFKQSNPEYVIFSGDREERGDETPVVSYHSSDAALILSRSPITLVTRGEVHHLGTGSIYFIPRDPRALLHRKVFYGAAALFLLCLSVGILFWCARDDEANRSNDLAVVETPSHGDDIPAYYFDLDLKLPKEEEQTLVASNEREDEDLYLTKLNECIWERLDALTWADPRYELRNRVEVIPWLEAVIAKKGLSDKIRSTAAVTLMEIALYHGYRHYVEAFLDHPDAVVRERAETIDKNWDHLRENRKALKAQ